MSISVIVCNGCCCGRVEKGHNEVPIDELEASWEANQLRGARPQAQGERIWLGELSSWDHYDAIVQWAIESSEKREGSKLPQILEDRRFVRLGESIVRLKDLG